MVNSWTCLHWEFNALFTSRRLIKAACSFANDAEHPERYSNYLYCKRLKTNSRGSVYVCVQFSVSLKWFRDYFISVHRYGFLWNTKLHNSICNSSSSLYKATQNTHIHTETENEEKSIFWRTIYQHLIPNHYTLWKESGVRNECIHGFILRGNQQTRSFLQISVDMKNQAIYETATTHILTSINMILAL